MAIKQRRKRRKPVRRVTGTSPYELWKRAGGGTSSYDKMEYLRLMEQHGFVAIAVPEEE